MGRTNDAAARRAAAQTYLQKHPASPLAESAKGYVEYLTAAEATLAQDSVWRKEFPEDMKAPLMQLNCLKTGSGKVYYCLKDARIESRGRGYQVEIVRTRDLKPVPKFFTEADLGGRGPGPSPQVGLSAAI